MATPARTTTPAPVLAARAKHTSVVGVKTMPVKTESHPPTMVPPPCSSFTPVKSPDQKRSKASAPPPAAATASLRRSLCAEMDATTASGRDGHGGDVPMDGGHNAGGEAEKDVLQLI